MNNPKISIIIIYGNSEDEINKFISDFENQKFSDYEAVFVNCNSSENAINIVSEFVKLHENWNMLTLPYNNDYGIAKQSGLEIVSGDYVCFVDIKENIYPDFISNIYYENKKQNINQITTVNNKLYKRSFLDNNSDIDAIIKVKIQQEIKKINETLNNNEILIKKQFEEYYKNTDSVINNKIYDSNTRCDTLQKLIYEKETEFDNNTEKIINQAQERINENNKSIYNDISKIYDYINSKSDEKGGEINKIYEEITKNYSYTEKILNDLKEDLYKEIYTIKVKTEEFINEQNLKYNNLERLFNTLNDDFKYKLEALEMMKNQENIDVLKKTSDVLNIEDKINKNFDKVYSYINENNDRFYKELSNFYKEIDKKIRK